MISFDEVTFDAGAVYSSDWVEVPYDWVFAAGEAASDIDTAGTDSITREVLSNPREESKSLWGIFIAGVIGGFLAFFMPCMFPMVPLTVSFFTKKSASRAQGVTQALLYGVFII